SNRATSTASNFRALASLMSLSSSGRLSLLPETPWSAYSATISKPRFLAYSSNANRCVSRFWPWFFVLTLKYVATRFAVMLDLLPIPNMLASLCLNIKCFVDRYSVMSESVKSKALGSGKQIGFSDRLVIGGGIDGDQAELLAPFRRAGIDELIHMDMN